MPLEKTALIEFASNREIMQRQFIASKSNNAKAKGPKPILSFHVESNTI